MSKTEFLALFNRPELYALTDYGLSRGRSNLEVVDEILKTGIKIVQYREKERKVGVMLEECKAIRAMTRQAGACFIVNDHASLALLCGADGVHVGQDDLPVPELRALLGPDKIIGLSTHSPEQALAAAEAGADYIGVGPIFATRTKKDVCAPVGYEYLEWAATRQNLPFVAIGGIKAGNIGEVARRGAKCCAVVSGIVGAENIAAAVKELKEGMRV